MSRRWSLAIILPAISLSAFGQIDTTKPEVRKMILSERRRLNCGGIYQQTRLKLDAQLKLANKVEASAGLSTQILANLNEIAALLGQKRREFCELYKVTPELSKDDYFRAYGYWDKAESDLDLIFRSATGKDTADSLKNLKTVTPRETRTPADVNAALRELTVSLQLNPTVAVTARRHNLDEKDGRANIRKQLTEFLKQGEELESRLLNPQLIDSEAYISVQTWDKNVRKFLDEHLGTEYLNRFSNDEGVNYEPALATPDSKTKQQLWKSIRARIFRLNQFLSEVKE